MPAQHPLAGAGATPWSRYLSLIATGTTLERTAAFSDAVFAIAMTVLVLELRVPEVPPGDLAAALPSLVGPYLTFVLSFAVVGVVWLSHHRKLAVITRFDQGLLRLNLVVLLLVASVGLPTAVLGRYGDTVAAVVLYAAQIAAMGVSMAVLWSWARLRRLVDPRVDVAVFRLMLLQTIVLPAVFLISIPVALLAGATAGELVWLLGVPAALLPRIAGVRRGRTGVRA
ncbi:TMEM175 family protein [Amnibacterium sp.]|uniref:TMEM175 family protein n=1 Tax=Amnibacterium sp. TaxID=1872496 RepID=UPI003F7B6EA0